MNKYIKTEIELNKYISNKYSRNTIWRNTFHFNENRNHKKIPLNTETSINTCINI